MTRPGPRPALRLLLTGAALVVPLLAPVGALSADAVPAAPSSSRATTVGPSSLRLGTYNIRSGVSVADFKKAVDAMKPRADLIGFQELGRNEKNAYLKADHDWGYYRPPATQQNPVIWRRDLFDVVSSRGYLLTQARDLGGELGAADETDNWATVVRLRERASGQVFSYINVHFVHGAVQAGKPTPGRPRTFALYVDQVKAAAEVVKAERAVSPTVYIGGDFNIGYKADDKVRDKRLPYRRFTALGMTSIWKGSPYLEAKKGTHADALIDQIWTTAAPASVHIERDITESDHVPAAATYDLAQADGYTQAAVGTIGFKDTAVAVQECNKTWQHPTFRFKVDLGDPEIGYVRGARIVPGSAPASVVRKYDFSALWDDDPSTNTLTVEINPDKIAQGDRTFDVQLIDPVNADLITGRDVVRATILDDDAEGSGYPKCTAPPK